MTYDREWPLSIPQDRAEEIVQEDLQVLRAVAETDIEMLELLANKIWRLNTLYTIADKQGVTRIFHLNFAQLHLYRAHIIHPRDVVLKSRQQGISTYELVDTFDEAIFKDNFTAGLMAQGKRESAILLQRSKLLWRKFPTQIKKFLGLGSTKDNT